jgi:hypothetical protein
MPAIFRDLFFLLRTSELLFRSSELLNRSSEDLFRTIQRFSVVFVKPANVASLEQASEFQCGYTHEFADDPTMNRHPSVQD